MDKGYVYILKSSRNNQYYIGSTINLNRRIVQHLEGKVKSTQYKRPWKLVFSQEYKNIREARNIEYRLKKLKRRDILNKIVREKSIYLGGWRSWERV